MKKELNLSDFSKNYKEESLIIKVSAFLGKISRNLLLKVITLWFTLRDNDTPSWAKTVILGALGYFIVPVDAVPDLLPLVGFSDDLTALVSASAVVWAHIKPEHINQAEIKIKSLLNN